MKEQSGPGSWLLASLPTRHPSLPVDQHQVARDALSLQLLARLDGGPGGGHTQQHAVLVDTNLLVHIHKLPPPREQLVYRADRNERGVPTAMGSQEGRTEA